MKKNIFLILTTIGLVLIVGLLLLFSDTPQLKCLKASGKWKTFSNACGDSCESARSDPNDPQMCSDVETNDCDCGPDKCWNGYSCEPN